VRRTEYIAKLKAELAKGDACKRCGLVVCKCWGEHEGGFAFAPTGKAFISALKIGYADAFSDVDWGELKWEDR
jgi:hypothetical protein